MLKFSVDRLAVVLLPLALTAACAHTAVDVPEPAPTPPSVDAEKRRIPPPEAEPSPLPRPRNQLQARAMLQKAFEASADQDVLTSVRLVDAVLAADFLTDRGRANLYWLAAEGRLEAGQIGRHFESLGMFLLAANLVVEDDELRSRKLLARSVLAARKVATEPDFGRSRDTAINIEDHREPTRIFAALPCGDSGGGHFAFVKTDVITHNGDQLVQHTAQCDEDTDVLSLWFNVTHVAE